MNSLNYINCQLSVIPESIGNLKFLRLLDLRENQLTSLPSTILKLKNLDKLDLRLNHHFKRPDWFNELEERSCTIFY